MGDIDETYRKLKREDFFCLIRRLKAEGKTRGLRFDQSLFTYRVDVSGFDLKAAGWTEKEIVDLESKLKMKICITDWGLWDNG